MKKPKSNLNFSTNINYSQSQTLVDTARNPLPTDDFQHSYTKNTTLGETVSWTTNIKKNFDMNFSYAPSYFISRNSLRSASTQNQDYFTHKFVAELTAYTNSGWLVAANFSYAYTNNQIAAYNASIPLFSPSIAKSLFKKKNGEIRLSVFDLFNSNTYVNKTASGAGYNLNRSSTLTRYTMLTFTWNLNKFPGSQQQGRMPGMFNNFRRGSDGGGGMRGGDF